MSIAQQHLNPIVSTAAVAALLALIPASAVHADFTWDGGGGDDLWQTDANWVGNTAPDFDIGDMDLIFGPTGGDQSPDLGADDYFNIAGLSFTGADSELTIIGTGSLTFNDGATILNDSNFLQTINVDIIGSGDSLIIDAMAAELAIGGDIDLTAGVTLTVQGSENTTISGEISGGNQAMLFKTGAGTLLLEGENTYSGGTEIEQGTIIVGDDQALGSGDLTASGDASLASNADDRVIDNGVNIDEEVTNLTQAQHAYSAAARVLTTIDEMLDLLAEAERPALIVATKFDKVKASQRSKSLRAIHDELGLPKDIEPLPVSSETGHGINALWQVIRDQLD